MTQCNPLISNHMKTAFLTSVIVILASMASTAVAQNEEAAKMFDKSAVPETAEKIGGFVPDGWKIEEDVKGDVNSDGVADHVLKLIEDKPSVDKDGTGVDRSRAMVIVFAEKDGSLSLATIADSLLQCTACGGAFYGAMDAPANVTIEKGVIVVRQDHGSRWVTELTYRFRYDGETGKFMLIGFDYSSRDRANGDGASESTNYLTGKRITTTGKGKRTVTRNTVVAKKSYSIEEVDSEQFEEEATHRLGLD